MNEKAISILRNTRTALQMVYEPLDVLTRWVNYKEGYPPLWMRQKVGGLNDFEGSGGEYLAYLKLLCGLEPGMTILDIGCGCGLMCLPVNENGTLPEYLGPNGRYVGIDIDKTSIDWCTKHIRSKHPICQFTTSMWDLYEYKFDVILAKSLFTHLYPYELIGYLTDIQHLFKPKGVCLATFFLLTDIEPIGKYTFKYSMGDGRWAVRRLTKPRLSVAYKESWIIPTIKEAGFSTEIHYGSWRGNKVGLSFQDIIILRR